MRISIKVKHWETRSPPTCSNYITLQYHTLFVHLTYIDGVIEVAVEKPIQARGSEAKSFKGFADKCGKIRESLKDLQGGCLYWSNHLCTNQGADQDIQLQ